MPPRSRSLSFALLCALALSVRPDVSGADSDYYTLRQLKVLQQEILLREPAERAEKLERLETWREASGSVRPGHRSKPTSTPTDLSPSFTTAPTTGRLGVLAPVNRRVNDPTGEPTGACQSEVSIASHGNRVVAAWNDGIGIYGSPYPDDTQGFGYSSDGGVTWTDGGALPNAGQLTWASDPIVAVNEATGDFYYCGLFDAAGVNGVAVLRGTFNGATLTWGPPMVVRSAPNNSSLLDKPWMAVDSLSGNLYVSFSNFALAGGAPVSNAIQFSRSTNQGANWSTPVTLSASSDAGLVQGSRPAVGPDGEIYVVWHAIGQSSGPNANSPFGRDFLRVRKSTDFGVSFTAQVTADSLFSNFASGAPGFNRGIGLTFPSIAVDRSTGPDRGRVYLAWNESLNFYNDPLPTPPSAPVRNEVENNNGPVNGTPFNPGDILRGTISVTGNPGDLDYWKWSAVQGQTAIFYLDSLAVNLDASFRVFCSDGATLLGFSQNGTGGPALLVFTAPTTATYFIRVASYTGLNTGRYRILTTLNAPQADRARDHRDLFVKSSANGTTWGPTARVNDSPGYFDDWLPEVQVDGAGRAFVASYDWRDAVAICGGGSNVYLYRSDDGGSSWLPGAPMTDFTTNWTQVFSTLLPNHGDYIGLDARGSAVHTAWADGRNGDPDVYFASTSAPAGPVVAHAGNDTTVECAATDGTPVRLDGSASEGAGLRFAWSAPGVVFDDPTSATPVGRFFLGPTTVELEVSDGTQTSRDEVVVTITDTAAPTALVTLAPGSLWPPNHELAAIHATIEASDACDPSPQIRLVSITSDEPDQGLDPGDVAADIQGADFGTADLDFALRSERAGEGDGRVYTVCYEARDAAGNATLACGQVRVPHDQRALARLDAGGAGSLLLFGGPAMPAGAFDLASLEIGTAQFQRWRPTIAGVGVVRSDGDSFDDVVLTLDGSAAGWVGQSETLWARWAAGDAGHLAELERGSVTGVAEGGPTLRLACSARPNPGRGSVAIRYALPRPGHVRLMIYDVAGHLVARVVDRACDAGIHEASFVASATRPAQLYLYRLEWAGEAISGKFVLVR